MASKTKNAYLYSLFINNNPETYVENIVDIHSHLAHHVKKGSDLNTISISKKRGIDHKEIISFSVSELPHTCGILEIGDLYTDRITQEEFNNIIKILMLTDKRTFIVNTNGKDNSASLGWEKKLEASKLFKVVKKFVNPSTGNTITIWISK